MLFAEPASIVLYQGSGDLLWHSRDSVGLVGLISLPTVPNSQRRVKLTLIELKDSTI